MEFIRTLLSKYGLTNILGTVTAILAMSLGGLEKAGCVPGPGDFEAACKLPDFLMAFIPVSWIPILAGITGALAFAAKLTRPGTWLGSLFGGTAVIVPAASSQSGPGTVTPTQVASK